jgi:hypothetical protein
MLDAGCWMPDRYTQHWYAFLPRRNEENEGSEESAINQQASRPSLSSFLRGENTTVLKSIGLGSSLPRHPASSIQHLFNCLTAP